MTDWNELEKAEERLLRKQHRANVKAMSEVSTKRYRFALWQDGVEVATVEGADVNRVHAEIFHYAMQYRQDGPCQIRGEGVEINFPARDDVPSVPVRWPTGNSR